MNIIDNNTGDVLASGYDRHTPAKPDIVEHMIATMQQTGTTEAVYLKLKLMSDQGIIDV